MCWFRGRALWTLGLGIWERGRRCRVFLGRRRTGGKVEVWFRGFGRLLARCWRRFVRLLAFMGGDASSNVSLALAASESTVIPSLQGQVEGEAMPMLMAVPGDMQLPCTHASTCISVSATSFPAHRTRPCEIERPFTCTAHHAAACRSSHVNDTFGFVEGATAPSASPQLLPLQCFVDFEASLASQLPLHHCHIPSRTARHATQGGLLKIQSRYVRSKAVTTPKLTSDARREV